MAEEKEQTGSSPEKGGGENAGPSGREAGEGASSDLSHYKLSGRPSEEDDTEGDEDADESLVKELPPGEETEIPRKIDFADPQFILAICFAFIGDLFFWTIVVHWICGFLIIGILWPRVKGFLTKIILVVGAIGFPLFLPLPTAVVAVIAALLMTNAIVRFVVNQLVLLALDFAFGAGEAARAAEAAKAGAKVGEEIAEKAVQKAGEKVAEKGAEKAGEGVAKKAGKWAVKKTKEKLEEENREILAERQREKEERKKSGNESEEVVDLSGMNRWRGGGGEDGEKNGGEESEEESEPEEEEEAA